MFALPFPYLYRLLQHTAKRCCIRFRFLQNALTPGKHLAQRQMAAEKAQPLLQALQRRFAPAKRVVYRLAAYALLLGNLRQG